MIVRFKLLLSGLAFILLACGRSAPADLCQGIDPVLAGSSFVLVVEPPAGEPFTSPLWVRGCSRTFESNVAWELQAGDGRVLASGHTTGGGYAGAAAFEFVARFTVAEPTAGRLHVFAPDESGGEGFPPPSTIIPLVLVPGPL